MEIKFNVKGKERKYLAQMVGEITGSEVKYLGVPSCNYAVSYFTIDRVGTLSFDDNTDRKKIKELIELLSEKGFVADITEEANDNANLLKEGPQREAEGLTVAMPASCFADYALENLQNLIQAKGNLIKKALGVNNLPILKKDDKVSFPWFPTIPDDNDTVKAYTHFINSICEMAKKQKRISSKEKEVDNEKYAFRCFLLRLGFIGEDYKKDRKILLQNLTGSSAFKGGSKDDVSE